MPNISTELIKKLRQKAIEEPFIFLIELFDSGNAVLKRLTNYDKNFSYNGNLYNEFPFVYSIPEFSSQIGQTVQLTFGNFTVGSYANIKEDLKNTKKIHVYFIYVGEPASPIYPKAVYVHTANDNFIQDETSIRMTFSRKIIEDKKFPFRRFNSIEHPTLYEDFADAPLK